MSSFNTTLGPTAVPVRVEGETHVWCELVEKPYARYYFSDETSDFIGPWLTVEEARAQMEHYVKYVLG